MSIGSGAGRRQHTLWICHAVCSERWTACWTREPSRKLSYQKQKRDCQRSEICCKGLDRKNIVQYCWAVAGLQKVQVASYCTKRIWLSVYSVVEQAMLDLLCEEDIRQTLGAHIAKIIKTDAAANRLSKWVLTLTSFMVPMKRFWRCETDTTTELELSVLRSWRRNKLTMYRCIAE